MVMRYSSVRTYYIYIKDTMIRYVVNFNSNTVFQGQQIEKNDCEHSGFDGSQDSR